MVQLDPTEAKLQNRISQRNRNKETCDAGNRRKYKTNVLLFGFS